MESDCYSVVDLSAFHQSKLNVNKNCNNSDKNLSDLTKTDSAFDCGEIKKYFPDKVCNPVHKSKLVLNNSNNSAAKKDCNSKDTNHSFVSCDNECSISNHKESSLNTTNSLAEQIDKNNVFKNRKKYEKASSQDSCTDSDISSSTDNRNQHEVDSFLEKQGNFSDSNVGSNIFMPAVKMEILSEDEIFPSNELNEHLESNELEVKIEQISDSYNEEIDGENNAEDNQFYIYVQESSDDLVNKYISEKNDINQQISRNPLHCQICSTNFYFKSEFDQHCSLHGHDNAEKAPSPGMLHPIKPNGDKLPFQCEICGKGFTHKQAVKHHNVIHTNERPHICHICKKTYRHRSALYKHKRSHSDVLAYVCDVCGKRFKHKSYLNIHSVVHTHKRPFSCNICGNTFRDRSARNKHLHAHSGIRPYSCEVCGKCFGRKGDYKSHSVIHTELRPYTCTVCGRGFRSSSNYHRHTRIHSSDCPYKCDICGKSFNQNWKLKEHKFIHSDQLPYVCEECGMGFKYRRKLKQHMENHARERLHSQNVTCGDQNEETAFEVINVQPDISVLIE